MSVSNPPQWYELEYVFFNIHVRYLRAASQLFLLLCPHPIDSHYSTVSSDKKEQKYEKKIAYSLCDPKKKTRVYFRPNSTLRSCAVIGTNCNNVKISPWRVDFQVACIGFLWAPLKRSKRQRMKRDAETTIRTLKCLALTSTCSTNAE